jgi:SAM-dependent methyltransferase
VTACEQYQQFSFPLNVYAYLQFLDQGRVDYLHFGLFRGAERNLPAAQSYSTELILERLPEPPCRILEVGVGLGTTSALLAARGYQVHGIGPDPQQIECARQRAGGQARFSCVRFEDFPSEGQEFELLLFQESAQYIDPLLLFSRAAALLGEDGSLLILDEFALRRTEPGLENLHLLGDLIALGERFGFELAESLDLSAAATPTVAYLLQATTEHRQRLLSDLDLPAGDLDQLDASNRRYLAKYQAGRFGYALLRFRKKQRPNWLLREVREPDRQQFQELFRRVFKEEMAADYWSWKYAAGRGDAIGAWREGRLVGHYGGLRREILFRGQAATAVQSCDVMADAKERGGMTRKGPFFLAATTFFERYIGYGKKYLIGFGFPNARAMRVAAHLGFYQPVDRISQIRWPGCGERFSWRNRALLVTLDAGPEVQEQLNLLWRQMAADLPESLVGVRDWAYLRRRYLCCPGKAYQIILIRRRFLGTPCGAFVVRNEGSELLLLDIIAPLANFAELLHHARRLVAKFGLETLRAWITCSHSGPFQVEGGETVETEVVIPAQIWSAGPELAEFRDRWWLTAGDTDFL